MPSTPVSTPNRQAHTEPVPDDAPWTDPVVVPDDIRALQPDIEAYHRELRQAARRRRLGPLARVPWQRLTVPLAIVTGALLLAGVVLVVLTFGGQRQGQRPPEAAPIATGAVAVASVGEPGGLLPAVDVRTLTGKVDVRELRPALVVLVPQQCRCTALLSQLAGQAGEVRVKLVVVAPAAQDAEVAALAGQLHSDQVEPVWDAGGMLADVYAASGVTALVVGPDATVRYIDRDVAAGARLDGQLLSLLPQPPPTAVRAH